MIYEKLKNDPAVRAYIKRADESLLELGYTEHSFAHATRVTEIVRYILSRLGYSERELDIACSAAYLHDIGNLVNRVDHSQSGAMMAFRILDKMGVDPEDIATVVTAIGNHDEGTGVPVNPIAAALILADKSDVRRSRVRNANVSSFDIHDRVNYSVTDSDISIDDEHKNITLDIAIDTEYSSVMEYFEIFLERMVLCRRAAEALGLGFRLIINGQAIS